MTKISYKVVNGAQECLVTIDNVNHRKKPHQPSDYDQYTPILRDLRLEQDIWHPVSQVKRLIFAKNNHLVGQALQWLNRVLKNNQELPESDRLPSSKINLIYQTKREDLLRNLSPYQNLSQRLNPLQDEDLIKYNDEKVCIEFAPLPDPWVSNPAIAEKQPLQNDKVTPASFTDEMNFYPGYYIEDPEVARLLEVLINNQTRSVSNKKNMNDTKPFSDDSSPFDDIENLLKP
jgi:hypothetical protein